MESIRLSRLHSLDDRWIEVAVSKSAPGVYVLDRSSQGGFTVAYVGRSNQDVSASLHQHVGRYRFFKFAYCASVEEAFEAECDLYHDYRPPDNLVHPVSPPGLKCPRCGVAS